MGCVWSLWKWLPGKWSNVCIWCFCILRWRWLGNWKSKQNKTLVICQTCSFHKRHYASIAPWPWAFVVLSSPGSHLFNWMVNISIRESCPSTFPLSIEISWGSGLSLHLIPGWSHQIPWPWISSLSVGLPVLKSITPVPQQTVCLTFLLRCPSEKQHGQQQVFPACLLPLTATMMEATNQSNQMIQFLKSDCRKMLSTLLSPLSLHDFSGFYTIAPPLLKPLLNPLSILTLHLPGSHQHLDCK